MHSQSIRLSNALESRGYHILHAFIHDSDIIKYKRLLEGQAYMYNGFELRYYDLEDDNKKIRKVNRLHVKPELSNHISRLCSEIFGWSSTEIHRLTGFFKPPNDLRSLGWHQDASPDWHSTYCNSKVLWFSLRDCDQGSGGLRIFPGSHRFGQIGDGNHLTNDELSLLTTKITPVDLIATVGDLIVFDPHLVHSSAGNESPVGRWAINALVSELKSPRQ